MLQSPVPDVYLQLLLSFVSLLRFACLSAFICPRQLELGQQADMTLAFAAILQRMHEENLVEVSKCQHTEDLSATRASKVVGVKEGEYIWVIMALFSRDYVLLVDGMRRRGVYMFREYRPLALLVHRSAVCLAGN